MLVRSLLSFLLAESALELVPKEISGHPSVRAWCRRFGRKPSEAILDATYMHTAMTRLRERERRGRPDIVHLFLLSVLESPAGAKNLVDVYVHTREDLVFYVEPGTHVPRAYTRFVGLFSRLLRGEDTPRIHPLEIGVDEVVEQKKKAGYTVVLMHEDGRFGKPEDVLQEDSLVIVGGFPHGDFKKDYGEDVRLSISDISLPAWVVGYEVVAGWERLYLF